MGNDHVVFFWSSQQMFLRRKGYLAWDGPFQSTNLWWVQISSSSDWPGNHGQVIKFSYPWESLHCN